MQKKNVHYAEWPEPVVVRSYGDKAIIDFPINVSAVEKEDETDYVAETVYSYETRYTEDLKERVENNYDVWLEIAKIPEPQQASLSDVIEALNTLTDLVIGGLM